nr:EAL domain-containing protein [uncultured Sulfurimonas sp.]
MNKEHYEALIKSTKKLNLLYVEDDKIARESMLKFLNTFFSNIDVAEDGEEAYEKKLLKSYDIIITDINMPKLNGIELIEKIRKSDELVSIIVFSAYENNDYLVKSIRYGVDGYLFKPMELEQFYAIISKIVKRIETENSLIEYKNTLEQKVEEKTTELRHRCYHEFYTNLPNSQKLQIDILKSDYSYMLLLDISHFATINKEYGKSFANHVLVKTARVLEHHIHTKAKLYKTESDRFIIMLKETSLEDVDNYCKQLVAFFDNKNIEVDNAEIHITFNIGVANVHFNAADTLINCEYALDKSKELGSRHYEIFDENKNCFQDEKDAISKLKLTRALILEDNIAPYFQPIKNLANDEIIKYEVLARGILDNEIISPAHFIRAAEKLGLITSITRSMINKSFKFFKDKKYEFSINITERDLLEKYLEKFLQDKIKIYNIDPSRVTFEILENITLVKNNEIIVKQLNGLREMGFKIAIDDFGIENSNFSRLLEINLDFIKIDGMFIKNLKQSDRNRTITRAIVNLAKTLGIQTVAEFVEDEEIYEIIKECGIDFAQGYHIGKPEAILIS